MIAEGRGVVALILDGILSSATCWTVFWIELPVSRISFCYYLPHVLPLPSAPQRRTEFWPPRMGKWFGRKKGWQMWKDLNHLSKWSRPCPRVSSSPNHHLAAQRAFWTGNKFQLDALDADWYRCRLSPPPPPPEIHHRLLGFCGVELEMVPWLYSWTHSLPLLL